MVNTGVTGFTRGVKGFLLRFYRGFTGGITGVLQVCYSGYIDITGVLQWCYGGVVEVVQGCYSDIIMSQCRVLYIGLDVIIYPPYYHGLPAEVCWKCSKA